MRQICQITLITLALFHGNSFPSSLTLSISFHMIDQPRRRRHVTKNKKTITIEQVTPLHVGCHTQSEHVAWIPVTKDKNPLYNNKKSLAAKKHGNPSKRQAVPRRPHRIFGRTKKFKSFKNLCYLFDMVQGVWNWTSDFTGFAIAIEQEKINHQFVTKRCAFIVLYNVSQMWQVEGEFVVPGFLFFFHKINAKCVQFNLLW